MYRLKLLFILGFHKSNFLALFAYLKNKMSKQNWDDII